MLIAIIADTHLPRGERRLPERCLANLRRAELILHAGDLSTVSVLDELSALGPPVVAVHGNVDAPALVEQIKDFPWIEHQIDIGADGVAHRRDDFDGLAPLVLFCSRARRAPGIGS